MKNTFMAGCAVFAIACGGSNDAAPAASASESAAGAAPAAPAAAAAPAAPAAPAPPAAAPSPEETVRAYLEAGSREDAAAVAALLDPACTAQEDLVRVRAVRVLGAVMTLESVDANVVSAQGDVATVNYTVRGSVGGGGGTTTLPGGGQVTVGNVTASGATKSGELVLRRIEGRYLISCAR